MSIMQLTQTISLMPTLVNGRTSKQATQPTLPGMESEKQETPRVSNRQIAEVLAGIADILEAQNGNPYRIQAYRNAARGILDLQEAAVDILTRGEALPVPGLGERLRHRIAELIQTGTITFHNGFAPQTLPSGVRALMAIEHIGPYTAIRLYEELGIDSPEKLWWAAQQQRIRRLSGFGPRSETRLKEAVRLILDKKKQPLGGVA